MSRMKDRQEQIERIEELFHKSGATIIFQGVEIRSDYEVLAEYLVDNGIGDKDRFEVSYIDSIPSGQVRIKPKTYKENNNEEVSDNIR